ncbi:uncharacterized protein C8A04DRAFT_35637 [Dichotomopilus funicola]|uniref:DUF8035 domain-containing protein n=1 Tax=Dichotomopilus funicola TaxID=1934379 RepID=A0AAN6V637_9PEZI|nr:hypothetical protein C8A04DRAFT_35637 [Dichotomopilus funicola]
MPSDRPPPDRYDRDRREIESDRGYDRYSEVRERFEEDDDHVYARRSGGGPPSSLGPPPGPPLRDSRSVGPPPRGERYRDDDDDSRVMYRERERSRERTRRVVYEDDPPPPRRRFSPSPPPPRREPPLPVPDEHWRRPASPPRHRLEPERELEVERSRVVFEERGRRRSPSPPSVVSSRPPPRLVRRQSSLDTFDRKPAKRYWERDQQREEYGPPARREDYRPPTYVDIPLPRAKALPPPRGYAERETFEDIQISDPHRYGDEEFRAYPPERVRETETIRTKRRTRSREARTRSRRRGRSSSSSSSSSDGGTTLTAKSEYPKKGKTRIPAKLVSKRALIEIGYPYTEEGNVVVVQKALGQKNIDDLLKLSDEYKKTEAEIFAARPSSADFIEERIERRTEIYESTPTPTLALSPAPAIPILPPPPPLQPGQPAPVIIDAHPPAYITDYHDHHSPVEVVKTTVLREPSPARYTTSSYDAYETTTSSYDTYTNGPPTTLVVDRSREVSGRVPVGPVALAGGSRHSGVYESDDVRLVRRDRSRHGHSRTRSRHRSMSRGAELVRAERLSTGELVLYEEDVELIEEPTRAGPRLERDRRGRMSISVPKYR